MKGIIAILALVRILQTAFTFSQLQGLNGTTPPNHVSPEYKALTTKMSRLSTEGAALKTRVLALREKGRSVGFVEHGGFHRFCSARHAGRNDCHCQELSIRSSHQHPHTFYQLSYFLSSLLHLVVYWTFSLPLNTDTPHTIRTITPIHKSWSLRPSTGWEAASTFLTPVGTSLAAAKLILSISSVARRDARLRLAHVQHCCQTHFNS